MTKRDPVITSKIMAQIRSTNTNPEAKLGKELWKLGLRYRKQYPIVGKPDFVIVSKKIAIFCDGDFWHGNNHKLRGYKSFKDDFKTNKKFWIEKIKRNIKRDEIVNKELRKIGWTVCRFWESSIKKDPETIAKKIFKLANK